MGTTLIGTSNAGGVGRNRNSRPVSGFQIDDCWSAIDSRPCSSL